MTQDLFGTDLFGEPIKPPSAGVLADRFIFPPFSVLSARDGAWQDRKRRWLSYGIDGETKAEGRADGLTFNVGDWFAEKGLSGAATGDTSIFDPVLAELAYSWFCRPGGVVVDPFAGGPCRGVVAGLMGLRYWGSDIRAEQVDANRRCADRVAPDTMPEWVCGDSTDTLAGAPDADLIFSCPPYGDLEKYSDNPADISTMEYHTFMAAYRRIILRATQRLRQDRFAMFVVGDFRNPKTGAYRNFVSDTIESFRQCGLELYNEAILVTAVGSLAVRADKQFRVSRKLGKTHQNILVFVKGDPRRAARFCDGEAAS